MASLHKGKAGHVSVTSAADRRVEGGRGGKAPQFLEQRVQPTARISDKSKSSNLTG